MSVALRKNVRNTADEHSRDSFIYSMLLAFVSFAIPSQAQNTINVPADAPTIQAAIDASQNGDTVRVAPGTYNENINFQGKAVTVTSSAGAATTIIDGGSKGAVVTFAANEPRAATLNGFTVQNGAPGVFIQLSYPTITNNTINNNSNCGIDSEFSGPLIQSNLISNSTSGTSGCYASNGGGIMLVGEPGCQSSQCPANSPTGLDVEILGNTFEKNVATRGGGAMFLWDVGQPLIQNNIFRFNQTNEGGGAIQSVNDGAAAIVQNLMYGNQAYVNFEEVGNGLTGGALDLLISDGEFENIGTKVVNNVIFGNTSGNATLPNQAGSQVYVSGFWDHLVISNNIIVGAVPNSAVFCDDLYAPHTTPLIDHNDVINTAGPAYSGSCTAVTGTNGNISLDPRFKNTASDDFHVNAGSPVIDAGNNSAPSLPPLDLDSDPRIQDATNLGHAVIDMGAYEYPGKPDLPPTATTLTGVPNPANLGQQVAFTAIVTSSAGTPSGGVVFADGGATLGSQTLNNGTAVYTTAALGAGSHTITASYGQTANFAGSSATLVEVINGLPSATTMAATPLSPYALQPVTLSASVTGQSGTGTGTVTFYDAGTPIGTAALNAAGLASLTYAFPASGIQTLTAQYSGDATYNRSASAPYQLSVLINDSNSGLSASPDPGLAFQPIALAAQVASSTAAAFAAVPYGTVDFYDGATSLGTATLGATGAVSFSTTALATGNHHLSVTYAGNQAFQPSTSTVFSLVVNPDATSTVLTASPNPAIIGQPVTLAATVSSAIPSSGTVTFFDGANSIGMAALDGTGKANLTTSALSLGSHSLTAAFAGTANLLPSSSTPVNETIIAFAGDFTIQASPGSRALYTGEAALFTVIVAPRGGFNQNVALSCSGLPASTTCTFSPDSIPQANGASAVTIQTSAPHHSALAGPEGSDPRRRIGGLAALAMLALLVLPRGLRSKAAWSACVLAMVCVVNGCAAPGPVAGGTPPGTYNITLTGTFSEYGQTLTHSTVVQLQVKSLF